MTTKTTTPGSALAIQELKNRVEIQERKYRQSIPFAKTLDVAGTAGAQSLEKLKLSTEGDFSCTHITIKLLGLDPTTNAPVDPATFGGTGVSLMLSESGWGRKLLRDFTALETIATPGYGITIYQPFPFEQVLLAGSDLEFDLRNSSAVKQRAIITLHGWQFRGSFKDARVGA